jgi:2',3'-cyclic-nucleotide 2'-phosphodiesterase (5'-nucleotidase family)
MIRFFGASVLALGLALGACAGAQKNPGDEPSGDSGRLRLILTTDEHGWLDPLVDKKRGTARGGVVHFGDRLRRHEGVNNDNVLLLSVGDMWTGPYESTVLKGEPMLEAMTLLGYDAAVVGNHDFDFGRDVLARHATNAGFPFLATNVTLKESGEPLPFLAQRALLQAGALQVGVIGLANAHTAEVTDPRNVADLDFGDYLDTVKREVPFLVAQGADVVVVLIHDDDHEIRALLPHFQAAGVQVVGLGHHDDVGTVALNEDRHTPLQNRGSLVGCNAGSYLRSYCVIDLEVKNGRVVDHQSRLESLELPLSAHDALQQPDLQDLLERTHRAVDAQGAEVLTQAPQTIPRSDETIARLLVRSWMTSLPQARVGITNRGGIRQGISAGPVALRDVISVLPFDNKLFLVRLSGAELKEVLGHPASVAVGARLSRGPDGKTQTLVGPDGKALADHEEVVVVINDFMYRGGDGYRFAEYDPHPVDTVIDWREPLVRHLRKLGASGQPLGPEP